MQWMIPGTVITVSEGELSNLEEKMRSMFLAGGIMLGQICTATGLEPYTVQNWVKRGFLKSPVQKRYDLQQFCRILNINMLKDALVMEDIVGLMQYINGDLEDKSDDLIDDPQLYFLFIKLQAKCAKGHSSADVERYLQQLLADYQEPRPGARDRVKKVLQTMHIAWGAVQLKRLAQNMVKDLKEA